MADERSSDPAATAGGRRRWLAPAVLAAGALLPLARVLADPLHRLPGAERGDVYKHAWGLWHSLAQLGAGHWPETTWLNAPDGGVFLDLLILPAALLAPVTALLGPVAASNLFVALNLWLVGWFTYGLARRVSGSQVGALAGGLLAQTSPYLLGYPLAGGVHERLEVWVFPLVVWATVELCERWSVRWTVAAVVGVAVVAPSCSVYGVYVVVVLIVMAPVLVVGQGWWPRLRRLLPMLVGLAVVLGASFIVVRWFAYHPWTLSPQPGRVELAWGLQRALGDTASLPLLFDPRAAAAQQPRLVGDELHIVSYVGWVPLLIALAGTRSRATVATNAAALVCITLALGPSFREGGILFLNPVFIGLSRVLPVLGSIDSVWQVVSPVGTLLGVGVACAVARLSRGQLVAAMVVVAAGLAERVAALPVPVVAWAADARIPAIYDEIDGDGPVFDIPRAWQGQPLTHGAVFLAQTRHHQPIPLSVNIGVTTWDAYEPTLLGSTDDWPRALAELQRGGMRWLVVHRDGYSRPIDAETAVSAIVAAAGPARADDGVRALFDLGEPHRTGPDNPPQSPARMPPALLGRGRR